MNTRIPTPGLPRAFWFIAQFFKTRQRKCFGKRLSGPGLLLFSRKLGRLYVSGSAFGLLGSYWVACVFMALLHTCRHTCIKADTYTQTRTQTCATLTQQLSCISTHIYRHTHTNIETHKDIHTYVHTHVRTYLPTNIHSYKHTYIHTCTHTYIGNRHASVNTQTYKHTSRDTQSELQGADP